jgi:pilus assembly protein CpaB
MSSRKLVMLMLALVIAIGTIVLARQALQPASEQSVAEEKPKGPQVLVASKALPAGSLLQEGDMVWQAWDGETKEHMLVKDTASKDNYIGALSRSPLNAGDPIMANRVFMAHEQGFLSAALTQGMRAISIKVTPVSGLAGLIFPGDRVDVIVAHNVPVPGPDGQNRERRVSETVVVNARVLGLDQKTDEKVTDPKIADVATLEVTPKDAEKIALISDWNSTMSLVLRSLADNTVPEIAAEKPAVNASGYTWDSDVSRVLDRPDATGNAARRVLVIRGKDSNEVSFQQ